MLHRVASGSPEAVPELFSLVYPELRALAHRHMSAERRDHTLQATELVHEVFLKLVDQTRCEWKGRAHFLAVAAGAMRRILVDHARKRASARRGGGLKKVALEEALTVGNAEAAPVLLALDEALKGLAERSPEKARLVEIHFFGGLTLEECAAVLDISPRTASRHWDFAQAWLYRRMRAEPAA